MLRDKSRIYLDYAASTPVAPEVLGAMQPYFSDEFGNAGSIHSFGQKAQAALDHSREVISRELGTKFNEIIFTASATEANNLALRGTIRGFWWNYFKENGSAPGKDILPHIITTAIEHESVLETVRDIEQRGAARVTILPVSPEGIIDLEKLKASLDDQTILVSVIYASNEIGTIQPIAEIGEIVKGYRGDRIYPLFHTDAVQAFQFIKLDVNDLDVDALAISAQKIYGPKGAASLFLREGAQALVSPFITGGLQESGFRSGTENVPAIAGMARAVELIARNRDSEAKRIRELRDYLWSELKKMKPEIEMNGSGEQRLPNNLSIYFPGQDDETLLIKLDEAGIAVSIGSACSVKALRPSYVIEALGLEPDRAKSSIRFTLGRPTTKEEIDTVISRIKIKLE
ncbi:MAG: cysteine desulfurase [Candidatus Colwellbacteria bacterium]|nr:cysteine desulfurase [Candidatus Colwellbacteria bacterium]